MRKKHRKASLVSIPHDADMDKNEKFITRESGIYLEKLFKRYPIVNTETISLLYWILGEYDEIALYLMSQLKNSKKELFEEELQECKEDPHEYFDIIIRILKHLPQKRHPQLYHLIRKLLNKRIFELRYKGQSEIEKNLASIQKMFNLTEKETTYCLFRFICTIWNPVKDFFDDYLKCNQYLGRRYLTTILDMTIKDLNEIRSGTLVKLGMINIEYNEEIDEDFLDLFQNSSSNIVTKNFYSKLPQKCLPLKYHMIDQEQTDYVLDLFKEKPKGSNHILLYGQAGTGKTSYAQGISKKLGLPAYEVVKSDEKNDASKRRAAILACLNMTNMGKGALIIVDEADNLLNTQFSWFFRGEIQDKGWLNQLLETSGVRMIWITNRIDDIDPSVLRRFSFSLHFKPFTRGQRITLWNTILQRNRVKRLCTKDKIDDLASKYKVSAGAIDLAIKKAIEAGQTKKEEFSKAVRLSLDSHKILLNGGEKLRDRDKIENEYSLEGLNTKGDLYLMMDQLKLFDQYLRQPEHERNMNMNCLFYGSSGTGKSHLAKYIAHKLDREILCKRASDILNPYVGGTEGNIKKAFQEAEAEDAVLVIDEADSLLFSRDREVRSWEVSYVNEFLSQMENFKGILICTTNRLGDLDEATMRRFNFKIKFRYLTGEGNIIFYRKLLADLVNTPIDMRCINALKKIGDLAPGDFKIVRDRFLYYRSEQINHRLLLQALQDEVSMKQVHNGSKAVGF